MEPWQLQRPPKVVARTFCHTCSKFPGERGSSRVISLGWPGDIHSFGFLGAYQVYHILKLVMLFISSWHMSGPVQTVEELLRFAFVICGWVRVSGPRDIQPESRARFSCPAAGPIQPVVDPDATMSICMSCLLEPVTQC